MRKVVLVILAAIGLLSLLALIAVAGLALISLGAKPGVPGQVILEVDFESGVVEVIPEDPFAELMGEDLLEIRDVLDALERGADDPRVKGLVATIGSGGMLLGQIQELRDAVLRFRKSGKPAIAFAETFGEFGAGNGGYYLATAFDEIHMQPSGDIGLTGLIFETMFLRGLFDKLDVIPRMDQRKEFKNAMNTYTEKSFTPAHREALKAVMDGWFEQMIEGIAEARKMSTDQVRALVDRGPFLGQEALDAGLVDRLAYRDEVYQALKERVGAKARMLYLQAYLERAGAPHTRGETIALIHGFGGVTRGSSSYSPLSGEATMGSDTVAAAFRAAVEDKRVKAILFRVDSPGGSFVASDTIWRETLRARDAGKPVIVSMGGVAGSGGYYVAMHADKIVAEPGTITGSIGVLGGKLLTRGMWNKLGITFDEVHTSENSTQWSALSDYSAGGNARFQASLDRIYDVFTRNVAEGRGIPLERVQEIARGRIWTGADAKELGLVDELGGYDVALRLAREAIDLEPDAPVRLKRFPARRSALEMLLNRKSDSSEPTAQRALVSALRRIQPRLRLLERALATEVEVLSMPVVPGVTEPAM